MATTRLYAPRPYDSIDFGIAGVAPILPTGTDVDNTKVAAVQAASAAAGYGTLSTSAGGAAPTPFAAPLRDRGPWQANTVYSYGDVVTQSGSVYVAPISFTSGSSFVAGSWTKLGLYDATDPSLLATYVTHLGPSNGTDDTATLNGLLAPGGAFRGMPGANYLITTPLLIPSNTVLDLTGCTVTLKPGSNRNLLNNAAVTPNRTVTDAAITINTLTVTSATAAFAAGDVGRMVSIAGAGPGGQLFYGKIASVTNTTTAVLSLTATGTNAGAATGATATVSAASMSIYPRDSYITLIGGTWDKGNNASGGNNDLHGLFLRRVDHLTIKGVILKSTAGKYAISYGDCTDVLADDIQAPAVASAVIQGGGPLDRVTVRNVRVTSANDDVVAFGGLDYNTYSDTYGDITNIVVDDVMAVAGGQRAVNVFGNAQAPTVVQSGCRVRHVRIRNIFGTYGSAAAIISGDDLDDVEVKTVAATLTTGQTLVMLSPFGGGRVHVEDIRLKKVLGTEFIAVQVIADTGRATASIDRLTIKGISAPTTVTSQDVLKFPASATVTDLSIEDVHATLFGSTTCVGIYGTVTNARLSNLRLIGDSGTHGVGVQVYSGGSCAYLEISDSRIGNINSLLDTNTGAPAAALVVMMSNVLIKAAGRLSNCRNASGIEFILNGVTFDSLVVAWVFVNGGTCRLTAGSVKRVGTQVPLQHNTTEAMSANGLTIPVDQTLLTPTDGDMITNTNATPLNGVGPAVYNAAAGKWKHMYTGTTS